MTVYVFGGPGKTGASTLSKTMAQTFGYKRVYSGGKMRVESLRAGFIKKGYSLPKAESSWDLGMADLIAFRKHCQNSFRNIDAELDQFIMEQVLMAYTEGYDLVVDSKLAYRLLNAPACLGFLHRLVSPAQTGGDHLEKIQKALFGITKGVWLHADPRIRAIRSLKVKPGYVEGELLGSSAILEEMQILGTRQKGDGESYATLYDIKDYPNMLDRAPKGYGSVINNSHHSGEEVTFALICNIFEL